MQPTPSGELVVARLRANITIQCRSQLNASVRLLDERRSCRRDPPIDVLVQTLPDAGSTVHVCRSGRSAAAGGGVAKAAARRPGSQLV